MVDAKGGSTVDLAIETAPDPLVVNGQKRPGRHSMSPSEDKDSRKPLIVCLERLKKLRLAPI